MAILLSANTRSVVMSNPERKTLKHSNEYITQKTCHVVLPSQDALFCRRNALACGAALILTIITFNYGLIPSPAWAEDKSSGQKEEEDSGVIGVFKSLFDPNEKTKSGKVLPKAYLKLAREVVKNLRESLKEDPKDIAKFRHTADAAKESIRDYLSNCRGQQTVAGEVLCDDPLHKSKTSHNESYAALDKARQLPCRRKSSRKY